MNKPSGLNKPGVPKTVAQSLITMMIIIYKYSLQLSWHDNRAGITCHARCGLAHETPPHFHFPREPLHLIRKMEGKVVLPVWGLGIHVIIMR